MQTQGWGRLAAFGLHTPAGLLLGIPLLPGKDLALNACYGDALKSYKGGVIYCPSGVPFLK